MSEKQYKLIYFNARGRAEEIRLMFHAAETSFEDKRITTEEWTALKSTTPLGQVPVLEVDGWKLAQSSAISRFVAKQLGFYGGNLIEEAEIDMWSEEVYDMGQHFLKAKLEKDENRKALLANSAQEKFPVHILKFENRLSERTFLVGDAVSLADIKLMNLLSSPLISPIFGQNILENYAKVAALVGYVCNIPGIKKYIKERPETQF